MPSFMGVFAMKKSTISLQSKKFNEDIEALKKELAYLVEAGKPPLMGG